MPPIEPTLLPSSPSGSHGAVEPARVVPSRYTPIALLGVGSFGEVWSAHDRVSGKRVALKILARSTPVLAARFAREAAALRLLDVPGVVRFIDAGVTDAWPWLAMELVEGTAFPGHTGRVDWPTLQPTVVALLRALARMHDAGILHRDLKPGNVLVDRTGQPTVLDFGLARGPTLGSTMTGTGMVLGTARYMAPEQFQGVQADLRADLYAAGIMIREALTGDIPLPNGTPDQIAAYRLHRDAPPIRVQCPDLPSHVGAALDALIQRRVEARPASAWVVLRRLGGSVSALEEFPWLGQRSSLEAVLAAIQAGQPATIVGPPGSGRTRLLTEVAAALGERPRMWAMPGRRPFESLSAVVEVPRDDASPKQALAAALNARLDAGLVLLADDVGSLDPWTREILAQARGAVVMAATEAPLPTVRLGPWTEDDLVPLFHGCERLFHVPSDAAAVLLRRSGGWPARVVAEIDGWVGAGLAAWEGHRLRVDRVALERMESGFAMFPATPVGDAALDPEQDELLAFIHLAGSASTAASLASARGQPVWQVELQLDALEREGALARAGGRIEPLAPSRALLGWSREERLSAHAALARVLPPGAPGRVHHLIVSGQHEDVADEALAATTELIRSGRAGPARLLLGEAVLVATQIGDSAAVERLVVALSVAAIEDGTRSAIEHARYVTERASIRPPTIDVLLEAAFALVGGAPLDAAAALDASGPHPDQLVEMARLALRVAAASAESPASHARVVENAAVWAEQSGVARVRAAAAAWRSRLYYQQGRLAEAAGAAELAATGDVPLGQRLDLLFRAATCWLEEREIPRARACAAELANIGRAHRLPVVEARAAWIERALANRLDSAEGVDEDLVEAVGHLGAPAVTGLVLSTEAAIAWRGGWHPRGATLAAASEAAFLTAGIGSAAVWARALRRACLPPDIDAATICAREACATERPDIIVEVLGILAVTGQLSGDWRASFAAAAQRCSAAPRDWRRGALSLDEAERAVVASAAR